VSNGFGGGADFVGSPGLVSVAEVPALEGESNTSDFSVPIQLRNDSSEALNPITHVYLLSKSSASLVPTEYTTRRPAPGTYFNLVGSSSLSPSPLDTLSGGLLDKAGDFDAQFRLPISFPAMPPGAVEVADASFMFRPDGKESDDLFRLRLFSSTGFHEFDFRLRIKLRTGGDSQDVKKASN